MRLSTWVVCHLLAGKGGLKPEDFAVELFAATQNAGAVVAAFAEDAGEELNAGFQQRMMAEALRSFNAGAGGAVLPGLRCWAYAEDGTLCGKPAVAIDQERGILVCKAHHTGDEVELPRDSAPATL